MNENVLTENEMIRFSKEFSSSNKKLTNINLEYIAKKANEEGCSLYSLLLLIDKLKVDERKNYQLNKEGWITLDIDIPAALTKKIKKSVLTGKLSAKNKEEIFSEALKLNINSKKLELYIEKELEIAKDKVSLQNSRKNKQIIIFGLIVFILIAGSFSYFQFYLPYLKDKNALRKFVVANNLNLRSTKSIASKANIITQIPYGSEIIVYDIDDEWAQVKANGKLGFMGSPNKYLVGKKDFYEVDGIFGNKNARELLKNSAEKKAVINYLHKHDYVSKIPESVQLEIYGSSKEINNNVWQFFGINKEAVFNTIAHGRYLGTNKKTTAIIITNLASNEKRLLLFNFNEEEVDSLIYEAPFDNTYEGIRTVWKNKYRFQGEYRKHKKRKTKLRVDAIEFGINNDLKVYEKKILIYKGDEGFREYIQSLD